jgi:predicted phage terminase large subunit-like protein
VILDEEPPIIATFIIADTAETAKSWNDATVFSFFGIYQIEEFGRKTNQYALHWLDCMELRIEPKDLEPHFLDFAQECMIHPMKPSTAWIEKKSTGTTLTSVMKEKMRTIQIREIERTRSSGNKTERFLRIQPYVAGKKISFTRNARHAKLCIDHMSKITANETHRWDDIADTLADAVRIALIEKTFLSSQINQHNYDEIAKTVTSTQNKINRLRKSAYVR